MFKDLRLRMPVEEVASTSPPGIWHRPQSDAERVARPATSTAPTGELADGPLVARVEAAYRAACNTPIDSDGGYWLHEYAAMKEAEHCSLLGGTAGQMLRDPARSQLFFGFDGLTVQSKRNAMLAATSTYDGLLQLAVALGVARAYNPEAAAAGAPPEVETLLQGIDEVIGMRVTFPNPFADEDGLATSRGIATFRSVQALYQAWRMTRLVPDIATARFLEIGGGLGAVYKPQQAAGESQV